MNEIYTDAQALQPLGLNTNNYISVVTQTEAKIAALEVQLREQRELRDLLLKNPDFERVLSLLARRSY